jgi:hypothetical protein
MKKVLLTLITLVALSAAFAQTKFPLTITCNEMNADVYINDKLYTQTAPNLVVDLPIGVYAIKVMKPGFYDFHGSVTVRVRANVINAILQPLPPPPPPPAPVPVPGLKTSKGGTIPLFPLNISSNVPGAQVFINGRSVGQTPLSQNVLGGNYDIRVTAPGYADFQQRMNVRSPTQINAILQGMSSQFSVSSNVNGADVIINGNPAGKTPFSAQLPMGSYSVQVRARGYFDFQQNVVVGNGPSQVNAVLQPLGYQVSVNANVQGAAVIVNGQSVGQTPFATSLAPGNYSLIVRAPGYIDYQLQLSVNGPQAINATLQGATASWQFRIPEGFLNRERERDKDQRRNMQLWVDGVPENDFTGQMTAGRHVLRFVSGGLAVETQVDVQAGRSYVFEPFLGINVK